MFSFIKVCIYLRKYTLSFIHSFIKQKKQKTWSDRETGIEGKSQDCTKERKKDTKVVNNEAKSKSWGSDKKGRVLWPGHPNILKCWDYNSFYNRLKRQIQM